MMQIDRSEGKVLVVKFPETRRILSWEELDKSYTAIGQYPSGNVNSLVAVYRGVVRCFVEGMPPITVSNQVGQVPFVEEGPYEHDLNSAPNSQNHVIYIRNPKDAIVFQFDSEQYLKAKLFTQEVPQTILNNFLGAWKR